MKQSVKFKSLTTGFTTELVLPFFNSLLEAQQYLIQLSANIARVSTDMLNSNADATTHKNIIQNMIPSNVSACIGINALTSVSTDNASCIVQSGAHLFIHTSNNFNLDADSYSIGNESATITLINLAGGWGSSLGHAYYAIGVRPAQLFFGANNLMFCNSSSGNIGAQNINSSMAYYLFLPCIVKLTDGTLTLQFIKVENKDLYAWYDRPNRKFVAQDASWFASKVYNTYYILDSITTELPSISGDVTDDIDTETGESETQDSEDNVGGAGNVTLINNVVNYDNYSPNYARVNTGFITPFEVDATNLNTLHSFLYSETILDLIKNYFAGDASKAIVDLFNIPIAPAVEANSTEIKVGIVPTGAFGNVLTSETATFNFGSIDITQGYNSNSFMDLDPYNKYMIFLPFIGFKTLNTNDIRSINDTGFKIYLKYIVDMLTGDFVAVIEADHNNAVFDNDTGTLTTAKLTKQVINTFSGNMRTAIPLNSINSREAITPALGALATAIAGASTGNPLVMAQSVGSSLNSMANYNNALIPRGDSLSGNIGNLTVNKAFVINQESPKYIRTGKSNQLVGYPVYKYMKITKDRGYVKVKDLIMSGFTGTAKEAEALEALLKGGVWTQ